MTARRAIMRSVPSERAQSPIRCRELTPALWPSVERLFGTKGACAGCWCMWWRLERGGALWRATQGEPARRALRRLVLAGEAQGVLAFAGDEPIGWCSLGRREEFPRVERTRAYAPARIEGTWSIPCFFVARPWRGRGVARALLAAAVRACRRHGARLVEGYPITTTADGRRVADAFAYTGPVGLFEELGFERLTTTSPTRPLVRLRIRR